MVFEMVVLTLIWGFSGLGLSLGWLWVLFDLWFSGAGAGVWVDLVYVGLGVGLRFKLSVLGCFCGG